MAVSKGAPQNPFTFPDDALANVRDFASFGGRNYADHNRDNPQLFNAYELSWQRVNGPPIAHGLEARLLTVDAASGTTTLMVRVPAGWRYTESADEATVEIFVAEGDLSVNGTRAGAGGFIAIPKDRGPGELSSEAGAQIFLWWNTEWPEDYYYDSQVYITNVLNEPWIVTEMPDVTHGIMHKALRVPDPCEGVFHGGPAGSIRLILLTPGFGEPKQERHHNCYEEMVFLSGDFFMPERGYMGPGTVFTNPPDLKHGGLITQRGSLMLAHWATPISAVFEDLPAGPEIKDHYLQTRSYIEPPWTEQWLEMAEYQAWRELVARAEAVVG
ncbi:MAG: hypothetical protein OXG37_14175 [Actinomycetia bacterium]|nr:hypothetical protein [Actinomycetes bacterium]